MPARTWCRAWPTTGRDVAVGLRSSVLRFYLPDITRVNFMIDFAIPERTMRETGPVT